jgi:hypothetical protein
LAKWIKKDKKPGKRGWHGIDQIIHRVAFIAGRASNHRIKVAIYRGAGLLYFFKLPVKALTKLLVLVARQININIAGGRGFEKLHAALFIRNR